MFLCLQSNATASDNSSDSKGQVFTTLLSIVLSALMLFARQLPQVFIQSYLMYPKSLISLLKSASIAQGTLRAYSNEASSSSNSSDTTSVTARIADALGQLVLGM
jgi:hypothetical protein